MKKINKVIVNVDSNIVPIDPRIYGGFIEHLGECIHHGIWTYDPVNVPLVTNIPSLLGINGDGVRKDVLEAFKNIEPPVLRAFGGCYSDVYHWKDAIGPRESRKRVQNEFWGKHERVLIEGVGPDIKNQFGTNEFIAFCEEIGAKPYINVNYGSGTPEEAADWVEYCNGSIETKYGSLRAKHGRKKPYNVKLWGIANEIYGFHEVGYEKNPESYAKKYLEFAKKMREKDPTIKLIACGWDNSEWNQTVLSHIGEEFVDYFSIHIYFPYKVPIIPREKHPDNEKCYNALMASKPLIENYIVNAWNDITSALGNSTHVRISIDEWGLWYTTKDLIRSNYNLQDGLWAALVLQVFQKKAEVCPLANNSEMINVFGAFQTDKEGIVLTPVYLVLKLFVDHMQDNYIDDINIECLTYDSKRYGRIPRRKEISLIECCANIDGKRDSISIMLINKHIRDKMKLNIEIIGFLPNKQGEVVELSKNSPFDYNTIENRNNIQIMEEPLQNANSRMGIELKPHSIKILKLTKK
ncbi:MAG: alpha-L-arabinofuranosidase C-terminal domain-containing protein [Candidatus Thorarchaeota archaeon]